MPSEADWAAFAPALKEVGLSHAKGVTADGVAALLKACPLVETLDLNSATGEGDILSALAEVAEDKLSNVNVRLDACRALSGCLVGRVYSSGRLKKRITGK